MVKLSAQVGTVERSLAVEPLGDNRWRVVIDGVENAVDAVRLPGGAMSLVIDGESYVVDLDPGKEGELVAEVNGRQAPIRLVDPLRKRIAEAQAQARRGKAGGPVSVRAPMPGKVVKVLVKIGDKVAVGQPLLVVEAMKMENELRSTVEGLVAQVKAVEGQPVEAQEVLLALETG